MVRGNKSGSGKIWRYLLSIVAVLFLVVGVVVVVFDGLYFEGFQYLLSSVVFLISIFRLKEVKVYSRPMFSVGFVFIIVGLGIGFWIWIFGLVLFLISLRK